MTNTDKGMIRAFFYAFQTISTIAQLVRRPWSTVWNFLARSCDRGSIENATRSGRPALLSWREERATIRGARTDRAMSRLELHNRYAPHVSIRTMDRVLREANIRKWLAQTRSKLQEKHGKARLEWALARKDWMVEDFQGILSSDECTVRKLADPQRVWVFCTPQKEWLTTCIQPRGKATDIGLMVWGCFWGKKRGPLVAIRELRVDGHVYIRVLDSLLGPDMQEIADEVGDPLFQQDNVKVDTARDTL